MEEFTHIIEFFSKLIFGIHLTLSFSGISFKTNKKAYCPILYSLIFALGVSFFLLGEDRTVSIYPFLIHLPLIFYLHYSVKRPLLHSMICLFFAFQFLSPRLWLGRSVAYFFDYHPIVLNIATVSLAIPLTWLIDRYFAPEIAAFQKEDQKIVLLLGLAPFSYYVMTYIMVIYSDILVNGGTALIDFVDASFSVVFLLYTVFSLKILQEKKEIEVERAVLLVLQQASCSELNQLHKQQELLQTFRHDLRHHTNYLDSLLEKNQTETARKYLLQVQEEQEKQVIYASDESVQLLVSKFIKASDQEGISMEVQLKTSDFSGFDQLNLCGLLSNGLENAIKFSKDHENPSISLEIQRNQQKLTIFIKNNFHKLPEFQNFRPITQEQGHGYGTKSMARIVEKYKGFSQFYVEQDFFIFRATLMAD